MIVYREKFQEMFVSIKVSAFKAGLIYVEI